MLVRLALWIGGLGFLGFGIACFVAPVQVLALADLGVNGAAATAEIRSFYGGLEIGLGAFLLYVSMRPDLRRFGLLLMLAAYGGIGLARITAMLIGSVSTPFLWMALAAELGLALLAAIALRRR